MRGPLFIPVDFLCPDCESEKTVLRDRIIHTQPASSRHRLLDVSDIFLGWTLYCFDCKMLFVKESSFSRETLGQLNSGKIRIFLGVNVPVRILPKGTVLKVKHPGLIVIDEGSKRTLCVPEMVTI